MQESRRLENAEGILYALAAYGWWGIVPVLFFTWLRHVPVWELLAHRIIWSVVFLGVILWAKRRSNELLACLRNTSLMKPLLISTVLVATNWGIYVYGVVNNEVVQTSLGYFMNPLVNVCLGMLFFGERLRRLQWLALGLALVGVLRLSAVADGLPWIALTLAFSFGLYGMVRKMIPVDGLTGLSIEILYVTPISVAYLAYLMAKGESYFVTAGIGTSVLLLLSGAVTAIPLLCFGQAARRLPLSTLGFIQFISPSMQFLIGVFVLREQSSWIDVVGLMFIWVGLAVYTLDLVTKYRRSEAVVSS